MVERSKQDGGAGWLADRDLEDGCSFRNIFLWYSKTTLEFQHLQDLTFHEFHELEATWMDIESTQADTPKVLRNESVFRCNMKSSWQTEIFHPLEVRLEEKLSFKHVTPWRIPGRTCRSISWETFLRRVRSRCSVEHHHYYHTTFITSSRETGLNFCKQIRFELLQGHSWWWDPSSRSTEPGMVLVYTVYTGLLKSCFKRRRETLDQHRNRRFDGEFWFASMWFPIPPITGY